MTARIVELMESDEFEPLLDKLAVYLAAKGPKANFLIDREMLSEIVCGASMVYDGIQVSDAKASKSTLHELKTLLPRVVAMLMDDANYSDVLVALGAPVMLALSPDQAAVKRAMERHEAIMRGLDDIARAAPTPAPKYPGRPAKTKDIRFVVGSLADFWETHTGHKFKPYWRDGKPENHATRFVCDIVAFIAPHRLGELPEVTEKIRHDWIHEGRDSWWRVVS